MSMNLYIYSGLGNIIAIVDSLREDISIHSSDVVKLHHNKSVNFDQLINILPPIDKDNDFDVKIYNNDGSLASNCINGARCVSKFIADNELSAYKKIKVFTDGGIWHLEVINQDRYSASFLISDDIENIEFNLENQDLSLDCINLGNPHGVNFKKMDSDQDFKSIGKELQNNKKLPDGINFGWANKVSDNEIDLRVYERGVGETMACGSGACAAAIIGIHKQDMISPIKVNFKEGSLLIDYKLESKMISAEGSANFIEERKIDL